MAKYLNSVISNNTIIERNIAYIRRKGFLVLKPSINQSNIEFVSSKNSLIYPLQGINQIGINIAKDIITEREKNGLFNSFDDFKKRMPGLGKNVYESLIYSGAFDEFGETKKSMLSSSSPLEDIFNNQYGADLKKQDGELSYEELRMGERKSLGFNLEYDWFKNISALAKKYNSKFFGKDLMQFSSRVIVELSMMKEIITKKSEKMLLGQAFDGTKSLKFVIFPSSYKKLKINLDQDGLYLTYGRIEKNNTNNMYEYNINDVIEKIR